MTSSHHRYLSSIENHASYGNLDETLFYFLILTTPVNGLAPDLSPDDDVIRWKHFPRHWPFVVTGEFPAKRPVTHSFDVFFDLGLNERLSKQSWGWWFEAPSRSLSRHSNIQRPSTETGIQEGGQRQKIRMFRFDIDCLCISYPTSQGKIVDDVSD